MGTNGPRRLFELLLLAKQAVFETATSPVFHPSALLVEVTRAFTTPDLLQREPSVREHCSANCPSNQQLAPPAGFEPAIVHEVARSCATRQTLAVGISGPGLDQGSAIELRQLSLSVGIEPTTFGSEVAQAFTTPQTFQSFFPTSLLLYFLTSSSRHTHTVPLQSSLRSVNTAQEKFREESTLTGFRVSNPSLSALPQK